MTKRIAIFIVNYNMPEAANALFRHIACYVQWPHDIILVDNGSDLVEPSPYTTLRLTSNVQTTGGWLAGLDFATAHEEYFAYWFLITSAEFPLFADGEHQPADPLTPLARLLVNDPVACGVHPALTLDSTTAWKHLHARGGDQPRQTWMIDNIASLYRADWFDSIGRFDPALTYAWGIDLETCWKARQQGRSLWVHEGSQVRKVTNIGYAMNRMNMSAEERVKLAGENMRDVLERKYGPEWNWKMRQEFVQDDWR